MIYLIKIKTIKGKDRVLFTTFEKPVATRCVGRLNRLIGKLKEHYESFENKEGELKPEHRGKYLSWIEVINTLKAEKIEVEHKWSARTE